MNNKYMKMALMALVLTASAETFAQQATDFDTRQKVLTARLNRADAKLKEQSANLNKTYNDVTPAVQEELNNREDSIYLELLSKKRTIQLEMAELDKARKVVVVPAQPEVTTDDKTQRRAAVLAGARAAQDKKTKTQKKKRK